MGLFWPVVNYLAAHLMQSYHMPAGATALPLALVGGGVVVGRRPRGAGRGPSLSLTVLRPVMRGQWPARGRRLHGSGDVAVDSWWRGLWRGQSCTHLVGGGPDRVTRTGGRVTERPPPGLFALSNRLGVFGGTSLGRPDAGAGRVSPSWASSVSWVAVLAAVVIRLTVRDSAAFLTQLALREGRTAPE